jgi:hypothetical protein
MAEAEFDIVSGRPMMVEVRDETGKKWRLALACVPVRVRSTGKTNADGTPNFEIDFSVNVTTHTLEAG